MDDIKNRNVVSDGREENYSDFTRAVDGIRKPDSGDDNGSMDNALQMSGPDNEANNNVMQTKEYWEEFTEGVDGILEPDNNNGMLDKLSLWCVT